MCFWQRPCRGRLLLRYQNRQCALLVELRPELTAVEVMDQAKSCSFPWFLLLVRLPQRQHARIHVQVEKSTSGPSDVLLGERFTSLCYVFRDTIRFTVTHGSCYWQGGGAFHHVAAESAFNIFTTQSCNLFMKNCSKCHVLSTTL